MIVYAIAVMHNDDDGEELDCVDHGGQRARKEKTLSHHQNKKVAVAHTHNKNEVKEYLHSSLCDPLISFFLRVNYR